MHSLGKVLHKTKDGALIIQCKAGRPPKEKALVYDPDDNKIGFISEIFGPVKEPYVTVKPVKSVDQKKIVGKELHTK